MTFARSFFRKASGLTAAGLALLTLTGCVSTAWLAHQIVRPSPPSHSYKLFVQAFAEPFYTHRLILAVPAPDAGTIVASVMRPADYDPEISVKYRANAGTARGDGMSLSFPHMPPPPGLPSFKRLYQRHRLAAVGELFRRWIPTLKHRAPIGTILMMPGFGLDKNSLLPWGLFFADRGWRVVLVDLRGQGASQSPYLTWGLRDREDLHRLVALLQRRHLLVAPWLYFGVSYGAGVALMAAPGLPRPDGVIAVAPWADAQKVIARGGHRMGGWVMGGWLSWLVPSVKSPEWGRAERTAGHLAGIHLRDAMPIRSVASIRAPVLYLGSRADRIAPPSELRALAGKTPQATLVLLPGLPHTIAVTDVPGFCPAITHWLTQALHQTPKKTCDVRRRVSRGKVVETYFGSAPKKRPARRNTGARPESSG